MNSIMKPLQMNEPFFTFNNSINYYSVIHFVEYAILSLIPFVKFVDVVLISTSWEILELFIPREWAKESGGNKIFDIIFNFSGYYFGKTLLKSKERKNFTSI